MPGINGQSYQHAMLKPSFLGFGAPLRMSTHSAFSLKPTAEGKPVLDAQGQPIGWTLDTLKFDNASMTLLREEWLTIRAAALQANPGLGILQIVTNMALVYGNSFIKMQTINLNTVKFNADPYESKNDQEALYVEIPLFVLSATDENGRPYVIYT